jgi:hypothetical protein
MITDTFIVLSTLVISLGYVLIPAMAVAAAVVRIIK